MTPLQVGQSLVHSEGAPRHAEMVRRNEVPPSAVIMRRETPELARPVSHLGPRPRVAQPSAKLCSMTFIDPESLTPDDWHAVSQALAREPGACVDCGHSVHSHASDGTCSGCVYEEDHGNRSVDAICRRTRETRRRTYRPDRREAHARLDLSASQTGVRTSAWALVSPIAVGLLVGLVFGLWWLAFLVLAVVNARYVGVGLRRRSNSVS